MSSTQKQKYKDMVEIHSSENGIVRATNEHSGMSIMMDMRKLSNHPLLMRYYYTDKKVLDISKRLSTHPLWKKTTNPQHIFEELAIYSDFQLYQLIEKYVSLLFYFLVTFIYKINFSANTQNGHSDRVNIRFW